MAPRVLAAIIQEPPTGDKNRDGRSHARFHNSC